MALHVFNDRELALIQHVIDKVQGNRINSPTRTPSEIYGDLDPHAPEVYIAKPTASIDGLTPNNGTGPNDFDEPGYGSAHLYRILWNDSSGKYEMRKISDATIRVFNLAEGSMSEDWCVVHRDKFGRWIIGSGSVQC